MIIVFGSSIAWGAWDSEGGWAERLKRFCIKKRIDSGLESGEFVYPLGVSGDTSQGVLERFDAEIDVRNRKDEKLRIIIEIGINDSYYFNQERKNITEENEYKDNILRLIKKSKKHNADLVFVGLTPVDERVDPVPWYPEISYKMEFIEKYNDVLKKICVERNIRLVEVMDKLKDTKKFLADGLHPNTKGHEIIVKEVIKVLEVENFI